MHEVSLGGVLADYLTGELVDRTTYEDLRQALARLLVEERGFPPGSLVPRLAISYETGDGHSSREADIAVLSADGTPAILYVFCPGQIHTYVREVQALARLASPGPCPLAAVTDMREALLFAVRNGQTLATGMRSLPDARSLPELVAAHPHPALTDVQKERESRILHAYTGLLKNCCGESCSLKP